MTGAEQRACPVCGTLFTWTPAAPRQKFCSTRCRQKWWDRASRRARRQRQDDDPRRPDDRRGSDDGLVRRDDPRRGHELPGSGDPGAGPVTPAALASCPHCRKPVAIVAWLVPPAAASVTAPRDTPAAQATNSDRAATLKLSPGGEFR